MEVFTVRRKKIVWLMLLAGVFVGIFAARNSTSRDQTAAGATTSTTGIFEGFGDVGTVLHAGSVEYDEAKRSYTIAGSGENMWFGSDAFQFAWKKVSGDVKLTADMSFLGKGVNEHRKAVLMIRQSLDADSPYADAALHGSGLTSLQYREEKGAATHEIQPIFPRPRGRGLKKPAPNFTLGRGDQKGEFILAAGSLGSLC